MVVHMHPAGGEPEGEVVVHGFGRRLVFYGVEQTLAPGESTLMKNSLRMISDNIRTTAAVSIELLNNLKPFKNRWIYEKIL